MGATLKFNSPEIRVGLDSTKGASKEHKAPKSSMIKRVGSKKRPTLTNEASMPKDKNLIMPRKKQMSSKPKKNK